MAESRTQKSLRNAKVALFFSVLTFALGFFSRKILLEALGADVLGLYTTAFNLCGFLNLAELGITSAVAFSLYKPLFDNDREAITEIVSIQGWLFRYVGIAMSVGALLLMSLFPVFFNEEKTNLPLWYSYATFGVIFISQVLGYFFCYQQTLLFADQKSYINTICLQGTRSLKLALQIIGIGFFDCGYEYWLLVEMSCGVLSLLLLHFFISRTYPWLSDAPSKGKSFSRKHWYIIKKIGQLVFHKVSASVIDKVAPVIIYALLSLRMVTLYSNYMMIVSNICVLVELCFSSINASVGNLVAEGNEGKIIAFYSGYKAFRYWFVSIICFVLYFLINPFMKLWIGQEYMFDNTIVILFVLYTFISNTCTCGTFLNAYGLYKDIWAPIIEAVLNIGLSILLGSLYGVKGILVGIIISMWLIFSIWKPYFLYTHAFKYNPVKYIRVVLYPLGSIGFSWCMAYYIVTLLSLSYDTFVNFMVSAIILVTIYGIISFVVMYSLIPTYKQVVMRVLPFK